MLDDIQYIFWKEEGEKVIQKYPYLNRQLHEIIRLDNPDLKIIATTDYDFNEMMALLTFNNERPSNVKEITIRPLSANDLNAYARELRSYGYLRTRPEAVTTIGSLFFDVDRIKNQYDKILRNQDAKTTQMLCLLCHAIKCLWMWKKRSRNQIPQLLDFLQFSFDNNFIQYSPDTLATLLDRLCDFICPNYQQETFEIEDIIVTHVFTFYSEKPYKSILELEKTALITIFRYVWQKDRSHFFRNAVKVLHRVKSCSNPPELQAYIIYDIVEWLYPEKDSLYQSTEPETTPEGDETDWVDVYLGTTIQYASSKEEARQIWRTIRQHRSNDQNALRWLLPRLTSEEEKKEMYHHLFDENGKIKKRYSESTYTDFQTELSNFLTVDEAKAFYMHSSFLNTKRQVTTRKPSHDPQLEQLNQPSGAVVKPVQPVESYESFLIRLKEFRIRCFSQNLLLKSKNPIEFFALKEFLQQNDKDVVPKEDYLFFFDFVTLHTWKKIVRSIHNSNELKRLFETLVRQTSDNKGKHLQLNKTFILNDILDALPAGIAYSVWGQLGDNCDGYTLATLLTKAGKNNFEKAKGLFTTFMEKKSAGMKIKIGDIYLNRLLDTTSTLSGIKECEDLFHKYHLLQPGQSIFDFPNEYTQGILYQRMEWKEIAGHMQKNRPQDGDAPRNIKTIAHLLLKAPNYGQAQAILFGDCPDCLTPEEQSLLKQSPYIVSEMFRKAADEQEGEKAREFFENQMDKALLNHPDANILNIVVNSKYIYPFYEDKMDMIRRMSEQGPVVQNEYTQKHLVYHFINSKKYPIPTEEKRKIVNDLILKHSNISRTSLQDMLRHRYYIEGYQEYTSVQPYPVQEGNEWKIRPITTLDYVNFLLDHEYIDGNVVASFMEVLKNNEDELELRKLEDQAIKKKITIKYNRYIKLKKKGVIFSDAYLLVKDYPAMKDICYQIGHQNVTYEQAENYLSGLEKKHGISIARTQIYWNNVISQMCNRNYSSKPVEEILEFIRQQKIHITPEIYYSLLHAIESEKDYLTLKALYKGRKTLDHLSILLKQCVNLYKKHVPEWAFVNLLRCDFAEWYGLLKNSQTSNEHHDEILSHSARYKNHQAFNHKGYFNQTFLFWWTIHYMASGEAQRPALLEELKNSIPPKYYPTYQDLISIYFPTYPAEMTTRIHACLNSSDAGK